MKLRRIKIGRDCALGTLLCVALSACAFGGQIVDRVVANVNGHVVLQSDLEQEIAFEAFSIGRNPDVFTADERKTALDRLIDRELLREQVRPSQPAPADQVASQVAAVRKLYPAGATDAGWHAVLQRFGLTELALEKRMSNEIQLMKLVEDRLRPSIQIDQQAVETYYHDELVPEMNKAGGPAKPLTEVSARIKDLLAEKKMNELLSGWLASLRSGSQIRTPDSSAGEQNR
ncbi:MAG: SurA N-terminal domain-containing protein [Terriglobales bacterium]|jgi:hypothetical protein